MKRLLVVLALLAAPAMAATDPPTAGEPYQQFRSSDRYRHVAIVTPRGWSVLGGNLNGIRQVMFANMGTTIDKMQIGGLEVHHYNSDFFESDKDHRDMWADMGAKYALTIVLWPTSSVAAFSRYLCADSTNTQLVVIGGADLVGATNSWGAADTSVRGLVDVKGQAYDAVATTNEAGLVTLDGLDTLWAFRFNSGRRTTGLPSGVNRVVRVLRPFTRTGVAWVADADSVNSNMPGVVSGVANDSVAAKNDYLGPIWRVEYAHGLTVDAGANTYQNSLAASLCPTSVYFVKVTSQVAIQRPSPMLLWSLICRFTRVRPIKWSYDWDDVTDKFGENGGLTPSVPPNSATYGPRWRQTAIDSTLAGLRLFGIVPTMGVNPEHAGAYVAGTGLVRYEGAMDGTPRTYLKNYPWVHHTHDSTASHIGGNLMGNSGGYSQGNSGQELQAGAQVPVYSRRFASRWNPGANQGGFIGAGGNFGIVQRLAYGDSIRRAVGNPFTSPPYMIFPSNRMLPVNWKARSIAVTGWNRQYGPITSAADSLCPIDSVLWALDYALNRAATVPGTIGRLTLRASLDDPRGQVGAFTIGANIQWDRDTVVAASLFMYPGERFTTRVAGRLIQATCVNSKVLGTPTTLHSDYIADANSTAAFTLGLKNPVRFADSNAQYDGEAFASDVQGVYSTPAGYPGTHDFGGRQASSVLYQHPGQTPQAAKYGDYTVDIFINVIASWFRGMDKIAGRATQVCVPGWQQQP